MRKKLCEIIYYCFYFFLKKERKKYLYLEEGLSQKQLSGKSRTRVEKPMIPKKTNKHLSESAEPLTID